MTFCFISRRLKKIGPFLPQVYFLLDIAPVKQSTSFSNLKKTFSQFRRQDCRSQVISERKETSFGTLDTMNL